MDEQLTNLGWPERIRLGYAALADGDPSVITALSAPDCVFRDYGAGLIQTLVGPETFVAFAASLVAAAPFTMEVLDVHHHPEVGLAVAVVRADFGLRGVSDEAHLFRLEHDRVVEWQSVPFDIEASKVPVAHLLGGPDATTDVPK